MSNKHAAYWDHVLGTIDQSRDISAGSESFRKMEEITTIDKPNPDGNQTSPSWTNMFDACNADKWCKLFKTGVTENGGQIWAALINADIVELYEYMHLIDHLYDMTPNDSLRMYISSPGGYIHTATQICSAMQSSRGKVITDATGICASAGSLLWSAGHECIVSDYALFMWHMSSHGDYGCTLSIRDEADYQATYVKNVLLHVALSKGFVTEEEVDRICTDPNYARWISAAEMRFRVSEYNKRLQGAA